jgi:hypothetical protein
MKNRGTKIAKVAKPIAKAIDAVAGTNIQNCGGCGQMERNLNAGMSWGDAIYDRFWPTTKRRNNK